MTAKFSRQPQPGDIYEIPDPAGPKYYAATALDQDALFYDVANFSGTGEVDLNGVSFFLRLPVSIPSIGRARWKKIMNSPVEGPLAQPGLYLHRPVGSATAYVYRSDVGPVREAAKPADFELEDVAVWDAKDHILPLLRFHFFGEDTPFVKLLRTKI